MAERKDVNLPMMQARADVQSVNEDQRTVDLVWSTGARVLRMRLFDEPFYEELDMDPGSIRMDRMNSGRMPLLNSHNGFELSSVLGVVENASINNGEGRATVRLSEREDVEPIWQDIRSGIIANVSVGYRVHRMRDVTEPEDEFQVLRAIDWEPMEVSAVPIGADDAAGFRSDGNTNACRIDGAVRVATPETEEESMSDEDEQQRQAAAETGVDAGRETETEVERGNGPDVQEVSRKERERVQGIHKVVRRAGLDTEFADKLVDDGRSLTEARAEIADKLVERQEQRSPEVERHIDVATDEADKFRQGATTALLGRAGVQKQERDNDFRGFSLREMARHSLEMRGFRTHNLSAMDMVGRAFTHSTSDFTAILADVINKAMLAGWEEAPETFQRWTRAGTLPDFKQAKRVGLNLAPSLDEVPEGAEYTYGSVSDRSEDIALATYGKMLSITRQAIINDDLDAFSRIPNAMGRAARRTIGTLVYNVLINNPTMSDGNSLFDNSNHGNLASSGAAPSTSTFDSARTAMATQTDPDGHANALNIDPAFVIVPKALEGAVRTVLESQFEVGSSSRNNTTPNSVRGMAEVVADGRLDGDSTTAYYFTADPRMHDTIEVSYLDGVDEPFLEQREGWNVDGAEFKVRIDAGVAPLDWRTFYKNPGA